VIAAEVLVVFLHRYLYNTNTLHPSLLAAPQGSRPSMTPHVTGNGVCAVRSRWQDPFTGGNLDETSLGKWPEKTLPWAGCPTLTFDPASVFFGQVKIGSVRTKTLTIGNPSESPVHLSIPRSSSTFVWEAFDRTLDSGQQLEVRIRFSPTSTQVLETTLTVTSTALGSPHRITISGKGGGGLPLPVP
jgi:hypothetical protein